MERTIKRNHLIDLFRIIGAVFIIGLHSPFGSLSPTVVDYINLMGRWVVPFYFIVSGYFFEGAYSSKGDKAFLELLKRLVGIFIISNIFYFLIVLILSLFESATIPAGFEILHSGSYFHLWFLASLIFGYIVLWFLLTIKQTLLLAVLSTGLIGFAVIADSYDGLFNYPIALEFPRFLLSIPLLFIGYISAKRKIIPQNFIFPPLVMIVFGIVLQIVEAHFLLDFYDLPIADHQFLVGTFLLASGIFLLTIRTNWKENMISRWGMKYSLLIYIYHPALLIIQVPLIQILFPLQYEQIFWFNPLIAFVILIVVLIIIERGAERLFRWIGGNIG